MITEGARVLSGMQNIVLNFEMNGRLAQLLLHALCNTVINISI